jgi:hypothetical protein
MLFEHIGTTVSGIFEYYCDGFEEAGSNYFGELRHRYTIREREFHKTYKVRLQHYVGNYEKRLTFQKLHGSVDYYPAQLNGDLRPVTIKRDYGVEEVLLERFDERMRRFVYERPFINRYPAFLTGSTQKIKRYKQPFYAKLFEHFKDNLLYSEKLVVIGYGFRDPGINEMLEESYLSNGKKILVVDVRLPDSPLMAKYKNYFVFAGGGIGDVTYEYYRNFLEIKG